MSGFTRIAGYSMSRNFLGIPINVYKGVYTSFPTQLCGQKGLVCPIQIDWTRYPASSAAPNQNVIVNIAGNGVTKTLDNIRSIFIDNTNSNVPLYVFFPDTGHSVTCAPNAEGWFPVYTNGLIAWIIGEGFVTGLIPQTLVLFTNIFVQPFTNYELEQNVSLLKASPSITRGNIIYNANFGAAALGDQLYSSGVLPSTAGHTVGLWNTPYAAGTFLYLTALSIRGIGVANNGPAGSVVAFVIEGIGGAGILINPFYYCPPGGVTVQGADDILTLSGMQIKLDAGQIWQARVSVAADGGFYQIYSAFTQSPI